MKKNQALRFIKKYNKFIIVIHEKPDGDCIGAGLALLLALKQMNKSGEIILLDKLPEKYKFLPLADKINEIKDIKKFFKNRKFQGLIFVDCGSLNLSGIEKKDIKNLPTLNIDHHPTNEAFGDINYIESAKAATSEILYDCFCDWKIKIDKNIATLLFAGIFTDTGGFQHSNTTLSVLEKVSELIKRGVKVERLSKRLLNTRSIASLKILGLALKRTVYNKKYNIVYSIICENDKKRYGATDEDLEGIINMISSSPDVAATLLLYETKEGIKGSLRTEKDEIDVSALAKALGGGGHKKASGFKIAGRVEKDRNRYTIC